MNRQKLIIGWLTVLTLIMLATVVSVVPAQRARAATTRTLTVGPAAFNSISNNYSWQGNVSGSELTGMGYFQAPLYLPNGARVTSITLYAYDGEASADVCVGFSMWTPATLVSENTLAIACTSDTSTTDPQKITDAAVKNNVKSTKAVHLTLYMNPSSSSIRFYGAKVTYTVP